MKGQTKELSKKKRHNFVTVPNVEDIHEWHFIIYNLRGSPYEKGYYHGRLHFPESFPFKPPKIMMVTPNGRFLTNTPICTSFSDFHPETWNPTWDVEQIISALISFMLKEDLTIGCFAGSPLQRRQFALHSVKFNLDGENNPAFKQVFSQKLLDRIEVNIDQSDWYKDTARYEKIDFKVEQEELSQSQIYQIEKEPITPLGELPLWSNDSKPEIQNSEEESKKAESFVGDSDVMGIILDATQSYQANTSVYTVQIKLID